MFFTHLVRYPVGQRSGVSQGLHLRHRTHGSTSIPRAEIETGIPVFEHYMTVRALDLLASVIGPVLCILVYLKMAYKLYVI
jgi:hypothetical protein